MSSDAIPLLIDLLKAESFTPTHPVMHNRQGCTQALDIAERFVREHTGPHSVERITFGEGEDRIENLLVTWRYYPQHTRHVCFGGHLDVVPVDAAKWTFPPFGAEIHDGYVYGVGATDMKGSVAAFLAAMKILHDMRAIRNVSMVLTTDEEYDATNGTLPMLKLMQARMLKPHAFLFGEPADRRRFGQRIAIGRPGSLNLEFVLNGVSGHPGYREDIDNPAPVVEDLLRTLREVTFPDDDPARQGKTYLTVTRIISDGGSTSITPASARVRVNIRYTQAYNRQKLIDLLTQAVSYLGADVIPSIDVSQPYSSGGSSTALRDALQVSLVKQLGQPAELVETGGTSDARFVQQVFPYAEVLEFGLLTSSDYPPDHPHYLRRGGMHQPDERAKLEHIELLTQIYADSIPRYCVTRKTSVYGSDEPAKFVYTA